MTTANTIDDRVDTNAGIDGERHVPTREEVLEAERIEYVNATYTTCCD